MHHIDLRERQARLGLRHGLGSPLSNPPDVADALVVLHATDPATIYLTILARTQTTTVADIEAALFDDRSMMRTMAMRRTLFVATQPVLPIIEVSSSIEVAAKERKVLEKAIADANIKNPPKWLADAFAEVLDALDGTAAPARQLTKMVPRLATKIVLGGGKYTVEAGATSRVLGLMAIEGLLARCRTGGKWTGRTYEWRRRDQWIPLLDDPPSPDEAAASLLRLYIERFGPVTITDLKWWTGWTMSKTKAALATLGDAVTEVEADIDMAGTRATAFIVSDDISPPPSPEPWGALLPSLDPTPMGWKDRAWYVGDHTAELFDRNGNIGPTIWVDGRIVGGWSQRPDGTVATGFLEKTTAAQRKAVDQATDRFASFVADAVVKPSFPTPLQKTLAAGEV